MNIKFLVGFERSDIMTIKQFLEKQPLDSDTILRFQFTDRYDVGWNHNTAKSSLKDRLIVYTAVLAGGLIILDKMLENL